MKKIWLFAISTFIALTIALYSKKSPPLYAYKTGPAWKTFEKRSNQEISGHKTTSIELAAARIPDIKRELAQIKDPKVSSVNSVNAQAQDQNARVTAFLYREERVLIGDIQKNDYQDEDVELEMINKPNHNWKEMLGSDLIRFQNEETKVMIKEEFPVIKIQNGRGQYLEQVIVTYLFKNGNLNSYRALIDSESGMVIETWDKTVHEKVRGERAGLSLPLENESGIITR